MKPSLLAAAVVLTAASSASAYTRGTVTGGPSSAVLFQANAGAIQFYVEESVAADLRNADNRPVISPSSDPIAALEAALATWSAAPDSAIEFLPLERTTAGQDTFDGRNVFVFSDTPETRSLTLGAQSVTVLRVESSGRVLDADVLFNPNVRPGNNQVPFSTDLALNTIDLQGAATHGLGLALGAGGNPIIGSVLYPFADLGTAARRKLCSDDEAFARQVYPAAGLRNDLARVTGSVVSGGEPAGGALVTAIDSMRGIVVSTLSDFDDGTYELMLPASPQGRYEFYVESLDGPVHPRDIQELGTSEFRTDLRPRFFGGNTRPQFLDLQPGFEGRADFNVETDDAVLQIEAIGVDEPGGSGPPLRLTEGPIELLSERAYDLLLIGRGIDRGLGISNIRVMAPGVTIREGSVRVDPTLTVNGAPVVRITVDVAPRTRRHTGSLVVIRSRAMDAYTGAILIDPAPPAGPALTSDGVVDAAAFSPGGVAPGMIASLFGSRLGPAVGVEADSFDPATGKLPTELAGVSVAFDGVAAPLFFVSEGQVNAQVPFEVAGAMTEVVVTTDGLAGAPVAVPVLAAKPRLFTTVPGGSQTIAVLADGSINSDANPASPGEVLTLFATGHGALSHTPETGAPAGADPLSHALGVSVEIGGEPAEALFAGLTPGLVGLMQINVTVPQSTPSGEAAVTLRVGVRASQAGASLMIQ